MSERGTRSGSRSAQRVLVAGVGNIFNADDGFGSAVVAELQGTTVTR